MGARTLMTVEEFAQMNTSETEDYELLEGELIPLSSGTPLHSKICQNVALLIGIYFTQKRIGVVLGEVDCRVTDGTVRRPDLSIFLGERLQHIVWNQTPVPFAPDIAVEVLSPSEKAIDMHRKVRDYLNGGSNEIWILDHENGEVFVHTKSGIRMLSGSEVLDSVLLPGFGAVVGEILV